MAGHTSADCPHRESILALARDELTGEARLREHRHIEQCAACRAAFELQTAGRYPRLPNYTILEQVGKGGFGVVYKAVHHAKERTEALKVLFSKTPLMTTYFENEVHLIARLRHPHIATLHEAHLTTPPLYYTMEFVEGERLNDYLRSHEVSLARRIEIIKTVAAALGYAHGQGVVHRDVKPQNVLIDAAGQPHIVDFGIAKKLGLPGAPAEIDAPPTSREGAVGTLGYIAPEQVNGQVVDARADIFALGALLFHCVTGEPARLARRTEQIAGQLRERRVSQPEDLAAIVARAVEPNPERRYQTCHELVADLDAYLAGRTIQARTERSVTYRVLRLAALLIRNHPYPVRAFCLIVAAALMTLVLWATPARRHGAGVGRDRTVMITFGPETIEAIQSGAIGADLDGLSAFDRKSWRLLYGRLMERLGAAEPMVIAWDYYFPDCWEEYDEAFVRGARTVRAPIVVGSRTFDINSEPELCPEIRRAVHSFGALLAVKPDLVAGEFVFPLCLQRGYEPPIPALSVAAFTAAHYPDCSAHLQIERGSISVRLRKLRPTEGERRTLSVTVEMPYEKIEVVSATQSSVLGDALPLGDRLIRGRVPAMSPEYWKQRTISFERVLAADDEQIRRWFDGRAVVIGQAIPFNDEHEFQGGRIFGCQIHAQALDSLLSNIMPRFMSREDISMRVLLWCAVAGGLVGLLPFGRRLLLGGLVTISTSCAIAGVLLGCYTAARVTAPWALEAGVGVSIMLVAGGLAFLPKALRARQLLLAPEAISLPADPGELPSTVLAEPQ